MVTTGVNEDSPEQIGTYGHPILRHVQVTASPEKEQIGYLLYTLDILPE